MKCLYVIALSLLFHSCNAAVSSANQDEASQKVDPPAFKMAEIPSVLNTPEERADYLVLNYWSNFNFSDTSYIGNEVVLEQAFADYIDILTYTNMENTEASLKKTMQKAAVEKKMFTHFMGLFEKYLYEANSPMRNEGYYIPVLEEVVSSSVLDDTEKIRSRNLLQLVLKNRIGESANDFTFTLQSGKQESLYHLKSEYTLLYFYNPGCKSCEEAVAALGSSPIVTSLIGNGKMKILAVYPDEEIDEWRNYYGQIPASWINCFDQDQYIRDEEVYDLKATPTIYLLDKDKKVLMKDVLVEELLSFLIRLKD